MDDQLFNQSPADAQNALKNEQWHREQLRRSNDIVRVANPVMFTIQGKPFSFPTNVRAELNDSNAPVFNGAGDYFVVWEQGRHRVPANGTADLVRYLADKYTRDMFVQLVNYYVKVEGAKLLEKEGKNKPEILLDKYLENQAVWLKLPRTDDAKLIAEVYPQLYLGIVKDFGLDEMVQSPRSGETDTRSPQEITLANLATRRVSDEPSKQELEKEVLNDVS